MIRRILAAAAFVPAIALLPTESLGQAATQPAPRQRSAAPFTNTWAIDKSHSEMTFSIRHIVSRVRGTFRQWQGTVTMVDPEKWEDATIDVTIQAASIFTDNERRDADLRTGEFFMADSFPTITFRSTRIERNGAKAKIHGNLTMRGVTKPVVLEGEFLGAQGAQFQRIGFEATTTLNRLDYGITWNRVLEGGGVTLGDEVTIDLSIAAVRRRGAQ